MNANKLRALGVRVTDKGVMKVRASAVLATDEVKRQLAAVAALREAAEPITCGRGCSCLTVCGDYYDHTGQPMPPRSNDD